MSDVCDAIQIRLAKLHLTGMPVEDDPEVKGHLTTCSTCRIYQDFLNHDHQELKAYAESLDTYVEHVQQKLNRRMAHSKPDRTNRTTCPWWAVAAAIPLVAGAVFLMISAPHSASDPPGPDPVTGQSASGQAVNPVNQSAQDITGMTPGLSPRPLSLEPDGDPNANGMPNVVLAPEGPNEPVPGANAPIRPEPELNDQFTKETMADRGGTVITAQGDPVPYAEVFLLEESMRLSVDNGVAEGDVDSVRTDGEGHFLVESSRPVTHIVALGSEGIAQLAHEDFQAHHVLTLEPWVTVRGDLIIETQPAAAYMLEALTRDALASQGGYDAYNHCTTDAEGRFELNRIPPGHMILFGREYEVHAGRTYELHLAAEGQSVSGQFVLPGYTDLGGMISGGAIVSHVVELDTGNDLAGLLPLAETVQSQVFQRTSNSDTGQFQAVYLSPGHYALVGWAADHEDPDPQKHAYRLWHEFLVPEPPAEGQQDVPIDLGDVELIPGDLMVADRAPDFDLFDLEGNPVNLASVAGKLVLLSFYRSKELEPPSIKLQTLKDIRNQLDQGQPFAMIGMLASAYSPSENRDMVSASELNWPHLLVGRDQRNRTHIEYDVLNTPWPWNILISPDGVVLAIGLQGDELQEAIEAYLP